MFENILNFLKNLVKKEKSKESSDTAKERLHLVLMQDRANVSADFLELMKQEIIEVIKKYIDVDEEAIDVHLGVKYATYSQVINFKNYGACSSRSRTIVIGVRKDLADFISPFELFPDYQEEKTLRNVIGNLPALKNFGEIKNEKMKYIKK